MKAFAHPIKLPYFYKMKVMQFLQNMYNYYWYVFQQKFITSLIYKPWYLPLVLTNLSPESAQVEVTKVVFPFCTLRALSSGYKTLEKYFKGHKILPLAWSGRSLEVVCRASLTYFTEMLKSLQPMSQGLISHKLNKWKKNVNVFLIHKLAWLN